MPARQVRSGGENVHASEVEKVLLRHPAVLSAAVVGLPHPRLGEQVMLYVVKYHSIKELGFYSCVRTDISGKFEHHCVWMPNLLPPYAVLITVKHYTGSVPCRWLRCLS